MTEDEAWDELERQQAKKWEAIDMAYRPNGLTVDVTDLINRAKAEEREACLVILETYPTVLEMIKAIRGRTE